MKISKRVRLWVIAGACFSLLGAFSSIGNAQEGEAVDADSLLMNKTISKTPAQTPTKPVSSAPMSLSADQKAVKEAQEKLEKALAAAKAENEDEKILAKKVALAKKMHEIRPTRNQIDSAVRRAASNIPEHERARYVTAMKSMLNYNAIERISIDAMVETHSLEEIEAMVEYFSKPEALSASKKIAPWARKVQPEIVRMIDRAMMRIRTGQ